MDPVTCYRGWCSQHVCKSNECNLGAVRCSLSQGLPNDPWLKKHEIFPPGHRDAPETSGAVFWRLIDNVLQGVSLIFAGSPCGREAYFVQPGQSKIHTLSLADNDFNTLHQLARLPSSLPYLRALDLSGNPIRHVTMLDELLSSTEKKGKANAGMGGLKILLELKLNGCKFREETLQKPNGDELYQQSVMARTSNSWTAAEIDIAATF